MFSPIWGRVSTKVGVMARIYRDQSRARNPFISSNKHLTEALKFSSAHQSARERPKQKDDQDE
jgi:hypothetical protein